MKQHKGLQHNIYWSGPRESDCDYTGSLFSGSVTFFGSDKNGNVSYCGNSASRIDHNVDNEDASCFVRDHLKSIIENDPDCRIMYYNPNYAFDLDNEIDRRIICRNDRGLMEMLNDKLRFRSFAEGIVPMLPMKLLRGAECTYDSLKERNGFGEFNDFVIQEKNASGGHGTFLMRNGDVNRIREKLTDDEAYIVTGYIAENISVNVHAVIFDDDILLFPASIQVIRYQDGRLLYRGGDFDAYEQIDGGRREKFTAETRKLLRQIQQKGYRGVIGIDGLFDGDRLYIVEVNNRFQGSSILVNKKLYENNLPSLQELTIKAFEHEEPVSSIQKQLDAMSELGSFYNYIKENDDHTQHIHRAASNERHVKKLVDDGYQEIQAEDPDAYLFSVIFDSNILSLCDQGRAVRIHPNIAEPSKVFEARIREYDLTAIKTSIINRGAVMTEAAKNYVESHGRMRTGTYLSLDVYTEGCYINCPLYVKYTAMSPFSIDYDDQKGLHIDYYEKYLLSVDYDIKVELPLNVKLQQPQIDKILFLATDRLRIQNNNYCTFAEHGVPCRFCEAVGIHNHFEEDDILRAIDYAFTSEIRHLFRHVLIGGLSNDIGREKQVFIDMCHRIRMYSDDIPIYLMSLPPTPEDVDAYIDVGVTEVGFNIEVYDRQIARMLMPGKGAFSLDRYFDAFDAATKRLGRNGAVRTAFIAGLEPMSSTLDGIKAVAERGVAPIISVFRPIPGTELENVIPPSDEWLNDLLVRAEKICNQYGLSLGPQCPACRNNTLSHAVQDEMNVLYQAGWSRADTQVRRRKIS